MRKFYFLFIISLINFSCQESEPVKITDEGLTAPEFLEIAPLLNPPVTFNETNLIRSKKDSDIVHIPTFRTYFPDTVSQSLCGKNDKIRLRVLGKMKTEDKFTYLFITKSNGKQQSIIAIYFNPKGQYLGHLLLIDSRQIKSGYRQSAKIDARYNINIITEHTLPNGEVWAGEQIYYFDPTGLPIMAVTNTNEDLSNEILGNPIDSMPRKHKYSGDYSADKKNLVSIRDGRTDKSLNFFIHFSKRQGNCVGELKGEADWVNKNMAVFRDSKSPCVIEFHFADRKINIKEVNGCGSYRDIKCLFEGSFPKVKKMNYSSPAK